MLSLRALGPWLPCVLVMAGSPLGAQVGDVPASGMASSDAHRIWGRVRTADGDVYQGFIRWDRNEGSWVDILDGSKPIPELNYRVWLEANGEEPAVRTIVLNGYRISWDEEDPDFPERAPSGVRFGHLSSLTVTDRDAAEVELRSGERLELSGGSTDIGTSIREIVVDVPDGDEVELDWDDLDRVDFAAVPDGARARGRRLYGTVEDTRGRRFTGYVSWDLDEILDSDVLDGDEMEGRDDREIPFGEIDTIEPIRRGARVTLTSGESIDLTGSNDVDRGNRGVQISDPALGMVEVEWRELGSLRLHDPPAAVGYDAFDGGRPLHGTVVTSSGEEVTGMIRWNAAEASTWELLNGRTDDVALSIELSFVERVERGEAFGATVYLRDGRSFEVEGPADVDWDNRGILVAEEGGRPSLVSSWRLIQWEDFREARFFGVEAGVEGREPGR